jgi:hypothetical protein
MVLSLRVIRQRETLRRSRCGVHAIRNIFLFFPRVGLTDIFHHWRTKQSVVDRQLATLGCTLVRTDLDSRLSSFGSPHPRFSSRVSAGRWNSFKNVFQVVPRHGHLCKSDRVLRGRDSDFRVVRSEIWCLVVFGVCLYLVFARCVLCIHVLFRPIIHVLALAAALACDIVNGNAWV